MLRLTKAAPQRPREPGVPDYQWGPAEPRVYQIYCKHKNTPVVVLKYICKFFVMPP